MIISHQHRYLFVELPHTGSTAISRELCEQYAGEPILWKHAYYHEFLAVASPVQQQYAVFSGIRNPLDEAVSIYLKYKSDHRNNYTNPKKRKQQGGHVNSEDLRRFEYIQTTQADFASYFLKFHRLPYDNWSSLAHHQFDAVIRFENIQCDFSAVLQSFGIEPRRPLPITNPTRGKKTFLSYYSPEKISRACFVYGPFMQKWGYAFPPEWGPVKVPVLSKILFSVLGHYRNLKRRYLLRGLRLRRKNARDQRENHTK